MYFGGSERLPVRSLSYAAASLAVAEHIPVEQVQIISTSGVGSMVNGVDAERSRGEFELFAEGVFERIAPQFPNVADRLVFGVDANPEILADYTDLADTAIAGLDHNTAQRLGNRAGERSADVARYVGAHIAYHDTDRLELDVVAGSSELVVPQAIVTVGHKQEQLFFAARRQARGIAGDGQGFLSTVDITTHHVNPPYFAVNEGEPMLADFSGDFNGLTSPNRSARADLQHLQMVTQHSGVAA